MYNKVGYHLVDHCNLNCAGCNHFSPLAKQRFASLEKFEKNIEHLSNLIDINQLNLVGGEPLLNPQIEEFIKISRKYVHGVINIITNGILLEKMPKTFFNTVNENDVRILISDYGLNVKGLKLLDKSKFKVKYISDVNDKSSFKCPFFLDRRCLFLSEEGLLYKCCVIGNIHNYERVYNKNYPLIINSDYINIYSNFNKSTLLKFLISTAHFCGYCREGELLAWKQFSNNDWSSNENLDNNSNVEC